VWTDVPWPHVAATSAQGHLDTNRATCIETCALVETGLNGKLLLVVNSRNAFSDFRSSAWSMLSYSLSSGFLIEGLTWTSKRLIVQVFRYFNGEADRDAPVRHVGKSRKCTSDARGTDGLFLMWKVSNWMHTRIHTSLHVIESPFLAICLYEGQYYIYLFIALETCCII
jgi:hypothetical protein